MQSQTMTDLLQKVVAAASDLPTDMQDDIARLVLAYADELPRVFQFGEDVEAGLEGPRGPATRP